jgi:hypothetical protein
MNRAPLHRGRARAAAAGLTAVEGAIGFAILGSLLAVAVPAFVGEMHASRFVEPVEGLGRLSAAAVAYGRDRPVSDAFPPNAPLTPAVPPRGTREVDPAGAWDAPTWKALGFRASPEAVPHVFSFGFDSTHAPGLSTFVAHAHGDLNGNGVTSTFEIRGHASADDPESPSLDPGMFIDREVE